VFGLYPQPFTIPTSGNRDTTDPCLRSSAGLTSPIAYLTNVPSDPFGAVMTGDDFSFGGATSIADGYYYSTKGWFETSDQPRLSFAI
jgi:hypothetical protein